MSDIFLKEYRCTRCDLLLLVQSNDMTRPRCVRGVCYVAKAPVMETGRTFASEEEWDAIEERRI